MSRFIGGHLLLGFLSVTAVKVLLLALLLTIILYIIIRYINTIIYLNCSAQFGTNFDVMFYGEISEI